MHNIGSSYNGVVDEKRKGGATTVPEPRGLKKPSRLASAGCLVLHLRSSPQEILAGSSAHIEWQAYSTLLCLESHARYRRTGLWSLQVDLAGKAAVVTGGATGVGRATAVALGARGCSVLINYSRSENEAEAAAEHVRRVGAAAMTFCGDVSDDGACREMMRAAARQFGRLDVLVQSAGTTEFIDLRDLEAVTDEHWSRIMSVNVKGAFQCARAAKVLMERSGGGEIVNVSSLAGSRALGSCIPYNASKAALNNLTLALSLALAPRIRVNAVAPGFIDGRRLSDGLGRSYESAKAAVVRRTPLRAVCEPIDVAAAIVSIIAGCDFVTGQILTVDGGLSAML